jgi:hypothetical protein
VVHNEVSFSHAQAPEYHEESNPKQKIFSTLSKYINLKQNDSDFGPKDDLLENLKECK